MKESKWIEQMIVPGTEQKFTGTLIAQAFELTPTLKLNRKVIQEKYKDAIETINS